MKFFIHHSGHHKNTLFALFVCIMYCEINVLYCILLLPTWCVHVGLDKLGEPNIEGVSCPLRAMICSLVPRLVQTDVYLARISLGVKGKKGSTRQEWVGWERSEQEEAKATTTNGMRKAKWGWEKGSERSKKAEAEPARVSVFVAEVEELDRGVNSCPAVKRAAASQKKRGTQY